MIRVPEPTVEHRTILVPCMLVPEGRHTIEVRLNRHRRAYVVTPCDPKTASVAQRLGGETCLVSVRDFRDNMEVVFCHTCKTCVIRVDYLCPFEPRGNPPSWPPRHSLDGVNLGERERT